ncbi:GDSL-type esterase/lipase family protein [Arthrobacter sp. ERGS1:01]|uniref:GDSL-type esterase/lipase family protein n=1 Tax=Arthrobacter sp. ERGS1:01 TaxID=1704044 RepID=UPI0009E8F8C4|nr:GDSL-type esterase/lipase family protein [Arthrobacter sp. ERGS1:01]
MSIVKNPRNLQKVGASLAIVATIAGGFLTGVPAASAQTAGVAASAPILRGGIGSLYWSDSSIRNILRAPRSNESCSTIKSQRTCIQVFAGGSIVWSPATGAKYLNGAIEAAWKRAGGRGSSLGYPLQNPRPLVQNGAYQLFEGGAIYWTTKTGAQISKGGIRTSWGRMGFERGALGYPLNNETNGYKKGGVYQRYQGGTMIWSSKTGALTLTPGQIQNRYNALGGPDGILGHPVGEKVRISSGWSQAFADCRLVWGPTTGAKIVDENTYRVWAANPSQFGWPETDGSLGTNGIHTKFQNVETEWNTKTMQIYSAQLADSATVVMLGDSQLDGDSYTEQGARLNGYTKQIQLAFGGLGYVAAIPKTGGSGAFAVDQNRILLPQGNPGLVIVNLGGNDASTHASLPYVAAQAKILWSDLKKKYPNSKIVVNGVMSRTDNSHTQRRAVDQVIVQEATHQGLATIPLAGMATTAGADALYKDAVHLQQAGHNLVAQTYARELRKLL